MTYRVPLELVTRVNGAYNDGCTTYKFNTVGVWCNGNTTDFDSVVPGSSPGMPAKHSGFGEMDIIFVFETKVMGSIPVSPAIFRRLS